MANRTVQKIEIEELSPARFPKLDLISPPLDLKKTDNETIMVRDQLRKKWLVLSPEEWVRQHVIHWLIVQSGFPASLLNSERGLSGRSNRTDVTGYDRNGNPLLLVECKAPEVELSEAVLFQAIRYNQVLMARFIWLSKGKKHRVIEMAPGKNAPLLAR